MGRRPSSSRWQRRQSADPFVKRARAEGWRSRAVFKLVEIQQRDRVLRPGDTVIDLGAAPGGWSQYARSVVGEKGRVIALDRLSMDVPAGVEYIQGDFRDETVLNRLLETLGDDRADLVMSDLAPNISGTRATDQAAAMHVAELALELATLVLAPQGHLLVKLFQGEGFEEFVRDVRERFGTVRLRKPAASRARSREMYLVAMNYRV